MGEIEYLDKEGLAYYTSELKQGITAEMVAQLNPLTSQGAIKKVTLTQTAPVLSDFEDGEIKLVYE